MISKVINAIQNNLLVCFPTETVYALGCSALNKEAIRKIYYVKRRSQNKPLTISVSDIYNLTKIANLHEKYFNLVEYFSPGPVTYILPLKSKDILPIEFFKSSVGVRIPSHPIAISILDKLKIPIVTTSVNISGEKSIYRARNIPQCIKHHLSAIIRDDNLVSGIESTVIDLTGDEIKILRNGIASLQIMSFRAKN
ncbi:MAG: threonylcarbamoyl-AMP synthase [Wolbachia endosymbiont of Meromenopon meropis]|nr:threonylcarbamoyl-AMP synthase [Wolbachia endosymbiont of Meromenopon meropis]